MVPVVVQGDDASVSGSLTACFCCSNQTLSASVRLMPNRSLRVCDEARTACSVGWSCWRPAPRPGRATPGSSVALVEGHVDLLGGGLGAQVGEETESSSCGTGRRVRRADGGAGPGRTGRAVPGRGRSRASPGRGTRRRGRSDSSVSRNSAWSSSSRPVNRSRPGRGSRRRSSGSAPCPASSAATAAAISVGVDDAARRAGCRCSV